MAASTITVHSFSRKTRKTKPKKAPNMVQVQISFFIQQVSGISHAACEVFYFQLHETLFNLSFFDKITNLWSSMQLKLQGSWNYNWSSKHTSDHFCMPKLCWGFSVTIMCHYWTDLMGVFLLLGYTSFCACWAICKYSSRKFFNPGRQNCPENGGRRWICR